MKTVLLKVAALSVLSSLWVGCVTTPQEATPDWRTSVNYRGGEPNVHITRQGNNAQGQRSRIEVGKSSDRYNLRYNNGLDIRLQNRGNGFKNLSFDIRNK